MPVTFTQRPSTDGSTQTRTVRVTVVAPESDGTVGSFGTTVSLAVDGSRDGSFGNEIASKSLRLSGNERTTVTFTQFIGAQPPYDLRAVGSFENAETSIRQSETITVGQADEDDTSDPPAEADPTVVRNPLLTGDSTSNVTPRIGPIEPLVMEYTTDLPFDTDSTQTACGQTVRNVNGDKDWRVTFTGMVSLDQAKALNELRRGQTEVSVRTALFGETTVDFDTLSFKRVTEDEVGDVGSGDSVGPIYEFQLQSKQESEDDSESFGEDAVNPSFDTGGD